MNNRKIHPIKWVASLVKKAPIVTTFTHNTAIDSLNKHICCYFHRTTRTNQSEKCGVSPAAATLPSILYIFFIFSRMIQRDAITIVCWYSYKVLVILVRF